MNGELVREIRNTPPATLAEIFYWGFLTVVGVIIAFRLSSFPGFGAMGDTGLHDLPVVYGYLLIIGSPLWMFLTHFWRWMKSRVPNR